MQKIKSKIVISIIVMLMIVLASSVSMGVIMINGQENYTRDDLGFNQAIGKIQVYRGSFAGTYYCTNHNKSLTGRNGKWNTITKGNVLYG